MTDERQRAEIARLFKEWRISGPIWTKYGVGTVQESIAMEFAFHLSELNRMRQSGPVCPKCGVLNVAFSEDQAKCSSFYCQHVGKPSEFFPVAAPVKCKCGEESNFECRVCGAALGADTKEGI